VAPEVAITESTTTKFAAATKFTATESASYLAAAETTESASHLATAETTDAAAMEAATTKAAAMEAASTEAATMEAATAEAAAVTTAHAATAAVATTTTAATATTRQRHRWRSQANGRNCQQRDNRFAQHNHSPSETLAPNHNTRCRWRSFWKIATGFDESITQLCESDADQFKFRERVVRLNSKSEIKLSARRRSNSLLQMKLELEFSQQKSCCSNKEIESALTCEAMRASEAFFCY
jgi:hypothetical protein